MLTSLRKSTTDFGKIYFWTATVHNWLPLLTSIENKLIIINSLQTLSLRKLIKVYAFVIMPNHIHLIWEQISMNGKETPKGSFLKFTAHTLLKHIKQTNTTHQYYVNAANKQYEIWQRDALGIELYSRYFAIQKLNYIHLNPVRGKWNLSESYLDYDFSSARFYEYGIDRFGFLYNLYEVI